MSNLLKLGSSVFSWANPETRRRLRRVGLAVLTCPPYVAFQWPKLQTHPNLTDKDKSILARTNRRISTSDSMFDGDLQRYFLVGLSGLRAVENVLEQSPHLQIKTILDLPCGCGRVGRFLTARFPESRITACDLMTEGVDFCAAEFGMLPVYSERDFGRIAFAQKYDLIWCGSLVTHLNSTDISSLFRLFERHLGDDGVIVFTTHGDFVAECVDAGHHENVAGEAAKRALELYWSKGVAFVPYLGNNEKEQYGFSITSPAWIRSQCELLGNWKEIFFQRQGWNNHQDVFGYVRVSV